jgi:hypothetical protein
MVTDPVQDLGWREISYFRLYPILPLTNALIVIE